MGGGYVDGEVLRVGKGRGSVTLEEGPRGYEREAVFDTRRVVPRKRRTGEGGSQGGEEAKGRWAGVTFERRDDEIG